MVGWFEYFNMVSLWNGAIVFCFPNGIMVKCWNHDMGQFWYDRIIEICQYGFIVKYFNDFFGFQMKKWWINIFCTHGKMVK